MDATIKDIARIVNVSYATVSRALNNKHGVNPETRKRILEEARRLNYRPNAIARGLVKRQTHSIGLLIPDITNPFYPEVARGVEDAAQEAGYSVFLCNTNWERDRELRYLDLLTSRRVDGLIIAPVSETTEPLRKHFRAVPAVYVGTTFVAEDESYVTIDNVKGGYLATELLIQEGRTPVAFIGSSEDSHTLKERLEGYKRALRDYGQPVDERYIRFGDFKRETGSRFIKNMVLEGVRPRGVFGENDLLAIGILQGAREIGLSVPEDLAVVGFDDIPLTSFPEISLTTIAQPKYEMGRYAVDILLRRIGREGRGPFPRQRLILEPKLVRRNSA
ncbi:MAG: LacI family DNA-binding transcriptional regulator [Spirochaetales bacterium]